MASVFGMNGNDEDTSKILASLLSDSVTERIEKIVGTLGKSLDKEMDRKFKAYTSKASEYYKRRYEYQDKEEEEIDKRSFKRAEEAGKTLANGIVQNVSAGLTKSVSAIFGTMGKMDLVGSFTSGTSMATELRRSMGQFTFGKNSLKDLGSVLTSSYKELKNQGLIVDPQIMYQIYSRIGQVINLAGTSAQKQAQLVVTMTKIAQSGLPVDISNQSSQNLRNVWGPQGLEKTVASIGLLSGKFENFTDTMASALYSNSDLINNYMVRAKGNQDVFTRYIETQTKVTGALADTLGASNATTIMDIYNKLINGGYSLGSFSGSVVGSQVSSSLRSQYGINAELDKTWAASNPDKVVGALVDSISNMLSTYGEEKLKTIFSTGAGSSFLGPLSSSDFWSIASQLSSGNSSKEVTQALIKSYGLQTGDTESFYAAGSQKYTAVEKQNFDAIMAGYAAGTKTYENATLEVLGVISGYAEQIAGGATWKALGQGATQGVVSSLITKGLSSAAGGGAPAAGSIISLLGSAGPVALAVAAMGALVVGAIVSTNKTVKAQNEGFGAGLEFSTDSSGSVTGVNGIARTYTTNKRGVVTPSFGVKQYSSTDEAIAAIDDMLASDYGAQGPHIGIGDAKRTRERQALEAQKRVLEFIAGLSGEERIYFQKMLSTYAEKGIIPSTTEEYASNSRKSKNAGALMDNFDYLYTLYRGDINGNNIEDQLWANLSWIKNGSIMMPGSLYRDPEKFKGRYYEDQALAIGTDKVPFDGYPAILHEGEMVIPAKRANFIRALLGQQLANTSNLPANKLTGNNSFVQSIPEYASGTDLVNFASAQIGDAYVWGGKGPDKWDCSGLIDGTYEAVFGKKARKNANSWGKYMKALSKSEARPGDLAVRSWGPHQTTGEIGWRHVGLVSGDGGSSYIHAKGEKYGVVSESDSQAKWDKWGRLPELISGSSAYNDVISAIATAKATADAENTLKTYYGSSRYSLLDAYDLPFVKNLQKRMSLVKGTASASVGASLGIKDNSAFSSNRYSALLTKYANKHGIPPILLYGMMMAESSGNPNANWDNPKSSYKGLMQVNQGKVDALFGAGADIYDPEINIATAANYLKKYSYDKFKHWTLAVGGYNAGPGYAAWMNAKRLLDSGYSWDSLIAAVGVTPKMSSSSNNIKDSYINSVYNRAGLPKSGVYLEKGGIIKDPVMAVMGEGKNDEAVIPLDDEDHFGIERLRVDVLDAMNILGTALCSRLDTIIKNQGKQAITGMPNSTASQQGDTRVANLRAFNYNM